MGDQDNLTTEEYLAILQRDIVDLTAILERDGLTGTTAAGRLIMNPALRARQQTVALILRLERSQSKPPLLDDEHQQFLFQ